MVLEPVLCPTCQSINVGRHGHSAEGKPRYRCYNSECQRCTFILDYTYRGRLPEVKQQMIDMAMNGSGIRDTARVLQVSPSTVIEELKKMPQLKAINEVRLAELAPHQTIVKLCQWKDVEAQADELWSFVGSKSQPRWLWHAIDHDSGEVLAYVLATHENEAFVTLKRLLEPFVGFLCSIPMAGEAMNACLTQMSIKWASAILKRLSANI